MNNILTAPDEVSLLRRQVPGGWVWFIRNYKIWTKVNHNKWDGRNSSIMIATYIHCELAPRKWGLQDAPDHRHLCLRTQPRSTQTTPSLAARMTRCRGLACVLIWTWSPSVASPAARVDRRVCRYRTMPGAPQSSCSDHAEAWSYPGCRDAENMSHISLIFPVCFHSSFNLVEKNLWEACTDKFKQCSCLQSLWKYFKW